MVFLERELAFSDSLAANLTLAQKSLKTRLRLVLADLREVTPTEIGGLLDYALFNPPWREPSKRGSPIPAKRAMRESLFGDLATLLTAAAALIKPGGGLTLSWPGAALARLMTALALVPQLKLSWLKTYRKAGSRFTLLLVGLIKSFN
jgi:tRNA1(Val) A37 N6-methylase TrmN6